MPVDVLGEAVEVLVELPGEARLADPPDPRHRHEVGSSLLSRGVESVLDPLQLAVAAHERRLEPFALEGSLASRDDPQRPPQREGLVLALELECAGVGVGDRGFGRASGGFADEHGSGVCGALDA